MNNDICCFCLQEIDSSFTTLACKHTFHTICIRQYRNHTCPLCRSDKTIQKDNFVNAVIPQYKDDAIVWIFGTFVTTHNNRNNIICTIESKQLSSGYFWRLYNNEYIQKLESQYNVYLTDDIKNTISIDIGSSMYEIKFDGFTINRPLSFTHNVFIQKNINGQFRPIVRAKWRDICDNLLIIGIHDMVFFKTLYVYSDNKNTFLFSMSEQQQINHCYESKSNNKIIINKIEYEVNIERNIMSNANKIYTIKKYEKNDYVCNY